MKTSCVYLDQCRIMNDDKLYLSNSVILDSFCEPLIKSSSKELGPCQKGDRTGPADAVYRKQRGGTTKNIDFVECIHYDIWPNSSSSFITRRRSNNWPSNIIIGNIKCQGCDVVSVGHHDSETNDMQWRISFPGEQILLLDLTDVQILCYALIKIILEYVSKRSGVLVPYKTCTALVCGALFMSIGRLKLH